MSWSQLNNFELQAARKLLCLEVSEAAEYIGKVSNRTWQYWEAGRSKVPADVDSELYALIQFRNDLINTTLDELEDLDVGAFRWYHTLDAFNFDYPGENKVMWRLHQSVCAYLFTEGGNVVLCADAPLHENRFIYKWFTRTTSDQLQQKKDDELAKKLGMD